jgi:asparagine synthase (glutamine-hydrolysing)
MPVFPKRRFQHGAAAPGVVQTLFGEDETRYRRHFETLHAG